MEKFLVFLLWALKDHILGKKAGMQLPYRIIPNMSINSPLPTLRRKEISSIGPTW